MPAPHGPHRSRRADWAPHALLVLVVALLLVLLASVSIWQERVRQRERAVAGTENLARLLEAQVASVLTKADVLVQALAPVAPAEARHALDQALQWVQDTARRQVPAEFRDSFLHRNPANRELLALAARLG